MVVYNFKKIQRLPPSSELVDIILSKTQRKTPTVVHKGYAITRIRAFYIRKVKFASQCFHDRLTLVVSDFPVIEDLHPFYADLINVLYDRDHYKLALGQVNQMRTLIDNIAKDYVRLLKYGDSLYRCKQLKRAALGRMCTLTKRHASTLTYLEEVRQHMARLPSIDPTTRTLIISGFPNVGKSSFINKVTRADVDVQPYAFTTKSLFVGHMDYKYLRWQVIDTPGILDHALEDRNTIEMQSITALAHLRAAVLYFVDPSEQCGYTLEQQASLFRSMAPLFAAKPLIVVANKLDLGWDDSLTPEQQHLLQSFTTPPPVAESAATTTATTTPPPPARVADVLIKASARDDTGVVHVRNTACDLLLAQRVDAKVKSRRAQGVLNRLHVATPAPRGAGARPPVIPASVLARREAMMEEDGEGAERDEGSGEDAGDAQERRLERDREAEQGGPGVYSMDWRKLYNLRRKEWAYDIVPEIVDGKNIGDFVDPDIETKLLELEKEEEAQIAALEAEEAMAEGQEELDPAQAELLERIRQKKALIRKLHAREKTKNRPTLNRAQQAMRGLEAADFEDHLHDVGMDEADAVTVSTSAAGRTSRARSRSVSRAAGMKRARSEDADEVAARTLSTSRPPVQRGLRDAKHAKEAQTLERKKMKLNFKRDSRKGGADRHVYNEMPKHLFSGKRKLGKTQRR